MNLTKQTTLIVTSLIVAFLINWFLISPILKISEEVYAYSYEYTYTLISIEEEFPLETYYSKWSNS